jgi:hypothetical protein
VTFSDRPTIKPLRALGCALYGLVATIVVLFFMIGDALGDCLERSDGTCERGGAIHTYLVAVSIVIAILGAILMARWAMRDDD